jgi:hypothetical protein
MSSSQNTLCIIEAYSASRNVPAESLHRYISDIQDTMVGPRNLLKDPRERLMAIIDEVFQIIVDEEDTMRLIW